MRSADDAPPRCGCAAPPGHRRGLFVALGGAAGGPAEPDPRRLLVGAERMDRALLALGLALGLAGCASIGEPLKALQQAVTPAPAEQSAVSKPAAAASAPAQQAAPEAPPVAPQAQRAFDDARRALAAGRADDAERGFRALTRSNPELGGPHANLGVIYRQAGKPDQAVAEFEQATKLSPEQPLYFNQLGIAYRQQGRFAKAREAYERAIALDAAYAAPQLNLGILHDLYLGDGARALELYERYQMLTAGQDATVGKWVADLKNRKPGQRLVSKKEQP